MILVTAFEPFGAHSVNPSEGLAKAVDGRRFGACAARGAILPALTAEGIPAYVSNTAGTYLCNQTLYTTLHSVRQRSNPPKVGLIHVPLLPVMVAATGLEQPSMDFPLMLRAVEVALGVLGAAAHLVSGHPPIAPASRTPSQ